MVYIKICHKKDMKNFIKLSQVLDLHAHTSLLGLFINGNSYVSIYRYERHIVFPKILSQVQSNTSSTSLNESARPHS